MTTHLLNLQTPICVPLVRLAIGRPVEEKLSGQEDASPDDIADDGTGLARSVMCHDSQPGTTSPATPAPPPSQCHQATTTVID